MGYVANQIIDFVRDYVDMISDKLKYDRTETGKVTDITNPSRPLVSINGYGTNATDKTKGYECRIREGLTVYKNDIVIVKVPNNDYSKRYIDGKLKQ